MAVDARKFFGCPVCGFRVTGREEACPRCGTKFDEKTLFECPFCAGPVPLGSAQCPSCHVKFDELYANVKSHVSDESIDQLLLEIIELEAKQVQSEDKRLSCPRCSWLLDGTEDRCPKCGVGFLADDVSYQCPVCAATVSADAVVCSECGASFVDGGEAEAISSASPAPAPQAAPALVMEPARPPEPIAPKTAPEPVPEQLPETQTAAPQPPKKIRKLKGRSKT